MAQPDPKALLLEVLAELAGEDGDFGSMGESLPALSAFVAEFAAPGFACVMQGLPPTPPVTFPGVEGVGRAWDDYAEAFEDVRTERAEVRTTPNHVVVLVDQVATTRHGGVEISQPSAMVFAFEDARLSRLEFHLDRDEALRSAAIEAS